MKFTTLIALAATTLAAAAPAAAETYKFAHDGVVYKVNETERNGVRTIQGRDSSGSYFTYRVRGTKVSGFYGRRAVSFDMPARTEVRQIAMR
jgi:hypothetical protein